MDLKGILSAQGYTDGQIKAIIDAMGSNKLHVSSVENPEEMIKKLREENARLEGENAKLQKRPSRQAEEPGTSAAEEIRALRDAVRQEKINAKLIVELTKARAADVDYMLYKAEKTGAMAGIKVDEGGNVTGVEELVAGLKKSYAGQFGDSVQTAAPMVRTGIKKLDNTVLAEDVPRTLEEAYAQKYSSEE